VQYIRSPADFEKSKGTIGIHRSSSPGKTIYASYPKKSANERLIDMKNSTWKTKETVHHQGRVNMQNKLLYNVGPREAYVVDKTFDGDMNFLGLGDLSHEGELIVKRRPAPEYYVEVDSKYENEHKDSKSRITREMRNKLMEDMNGEHNYIIDSPNKYRRAAI
jgi:hypothetical protein